MSKIKSIKYIGTKDTYDLEVEHRDHQFYLANGVLTSNSHSISYSHISYYTAWLRHYYPTEFMCALINSEDQNSNEVVEYLDGCKKMDIEILPPDINYSGGQYAVLDDKQIVTGVNAVKGVGGKAINNIIENQPYTSLAHFFGKTNGRIVNKRVVQALAKVGAFSSFGRTRKDLFDNYAKYRTKVNNYIKKEHSKYYDSIKGDIDLLDKESKQRLEESLTEETNIYITENLEALLSKVELSKIEEEFSKKEMLLYEQEILGRTPSGSLHEIFKGFFSSGSQCVALNQIGGLAEKTKVRVEAIVKSKVKENKIKKQGSKNFGRKFAKYLIEDKNGCTTTVTLWPEHYEKYKASLTDGTPFKAICGVTEYMGQKDLVLYSMERIYGKNGV